MTAKNLSPNRSEKSRRNKSALNSALSLLSRRPYSQKEVFDHLIRYWPEADTQGAINKLKELKFIDDKEFATWYTQSRLRSRPMSAKLLTLELKKKGITINYELITTSEADLAEKAMEKKIEKWKKLPHREFKTKASRYLQSRGFAWDTIETILKKEYNDPNVNS